MEFYSQKMRIKIEYQFSNCKSALKTIPVQENLTYIIYFICSNYCILVDIPDHQPLKELVCSGYTYKCHGRGQIW